MPIDSLTFSFFKGPFRSGDAEICYNVVRFFEPTQIVEIGCGHSSMLMQHAIAKNHEINSNYSCNHICIEPFEAAYLKDLKVDIVKKSVTEMDLGIFKSLNAGDILFIDNSLFSWQNSFNIVFFNNPVVLISLNKFNKKRVMPNFSCVSLKFRFNVFMLCTFVP